jgi:hypothetical protein
VATDSYSTWISVFINIKGGRELREGGENRERKERENREKREQRGRERYLPPFTFSQTDAVPSNDAQARYFPVQQIN